MTASPKKKWEISDWTVFRITAIAGSVIGLAVLCWLLSGVLLLVFGAVLFSIILRSISRPLARHTFLSDQFAVIVAALLIFTVIAGLLALFGTRISGQIAELSKTIPAAIATLEQKLGLGDIYQQLIRNAESSYGRILSGLTNVTLGIASALTDAVVIAVAGIFIAFHPSSYKQGILLLFPRNQRDELAKILDHSAIALRQWLLGQLIAMVLVGVSTGLALFFVGLPSPAALGVIAGLAEFIPMLGPIIGGIAPMLLAITQGWWTVLWTFLALLAVQQIESNVIMPVVQRRMVSLPPALTMFAVFAFGTLFGVLGVLFATPMLVIAYVFVTELYVRDTLGEDVPIPGQRNSRRDPDS